MKIEFTMRGNPFNTETHLGIIFLHEEGLSHRQIADRLGCNQSTVTRTIQRPIDTGSVQSRLRNGRQRVTNDRYVAQVTRRNRSITTSGIRRHFQQTYHQVVSTATIRRRVIASDLLSGRPLRVRRVLPRHKVSRLAWAHYHQNWVFPNSQMFCFRMKQGSDCLVMTSDDESGENGEDNTDDLLMPEK